MPLPSLPLTLGTTSGDASGSGLRRAMQIVQGGPSFSDLAAPNTPLPGTGYYVPTAFDAAYDGVTDDTGAIAAMITRMVANGGGTIFLPPGNIRASFIIPQSGTPAVQNTRIHIQGAGHGVTNIIAPSPTTTCLSHDMTAANATAGCRYAGFTVKPDVAAAGVGSGALIDLSGFIFSTFEDIAYSDNGAGYSETFITLSAYRSGAFRPCYYNSIIRPMSYSQYGPLTGIKFENGGTANVFLNANAIYISQPSFYSMNGMQVAIDALRSAGVVIDGGRFEALGLPTLATAIVLGKMTSVRGGFFEANALNDEIKFATAVDGTSALCEISGNHLSGGGVITIPANCDNNTWENNASTKTFVDNGSLNVIRYGSTALSYAADFRTRLANLGAGGSVWDLAVTSTASVYGAGMVVVVDIGNGQNAMIFYEPAAGYVACFGRNATNAALRAVPKDDTSQTSPVFDVTTFDQSTTRMYIAKSGDYYRAGVKVLGAQGAAVADATGAGDVVAQLNAALARLRAHGLIAP
jgi:hypothetical protein